MQVRLMLHALERWDEMTIYLDWMNQEKAIRRRYYERIVFSQEHEPWRSARWGKD